MKKNGFTLAELLGVMVILALISIITVPAVTESLNTYKTKLCNSQIDEIISAAKTWGNENMLLLPDEEGDTYEITLRTLAEYGYIDKKVNNPVTNNNFDLDDTIVTITKKGKRYKYSMNSDTVDTCYSNGVKKTNESSYNNITREYPSVIYSFPTEEIHVGDSIDKIKYELSPGKSTNSKWGAYIKSTVSSSGRITENILCGIEQSRAFCFKTSGTDLVKNDIDNYLTFSNNKTCGVLGDNGRCQGVDFILIYGKTNTLGNSITNTPTGDFCRADDKSAICDKTN